MALATLALALFTWRLARRTSDLATSTAAEVRAGLRPALIHASGGSVPVVIPNGHGTGVLRLPLLNAGRGPALNVYAYAIVATSEVSSRTEIAPVGNVAPDHAADMVIAGVPNGDHGDDEDRTSYTVYVTIIYDDLAEQSYYTVIALSDPAKGQAVRPPRDYVGDPLPRALTPGGTKMGPGTAPLPRGASPSPGLTLMTTSANDWRRRRCWYSGATAWERARARSRPRRRGGGIARSAQALPPRMRSVVCATRWLMTGSPRTKQPSGSRVSGTLARTPGKNRGCERPAEGLGGQLGTSQRSADSSCGRWTREAPAVAA